MPRFVGKRSHGWWWDAVAVVVLAVIVFVVLELTGTIDLFSSAARSLLA
jgi:hypothetical protein